MATSLEELRGLGAKAGPRFVEPRRGLVKAMARRAKMSHLGAFQILPEHVVLSCLARVRSENHDARRQLLDRLSSTDAQRRFVKARRAEDITEETFVAVTRDCGLLALVSGRMWRRLAPMPPEMRIDLDSDIRFWGSGITVIGTELFIAGGMRSNGSSAVAVHDAVDNSWFSMPLPPSSPINFFALGCAGRLFGGAFKGTLMVLWPQPRTASFSGLGMRTLRNGSSYLRCRSRWGTPGRRWG